MNNNRILVRMSGEVETYLERVMRLSVVFLFQCWEKLKYERQINTDRRRRVMKLPCIAEGQASFGWEEGHYF